MCLYRQQQSLGTIIYTVRNTENKKKYIKETALEHDIGRDCLAALDSRR